MSVMGDVGVSPVRLKNTSKNGATSCKLAGGGEPGASGPMPGGATLVL